jgi:hypothetical protein
MVILTVATSQAPPYQTYKNRLKFEVNGDYLLIKVRTKEGQNEYQVNGITIWYGNTKEMQNIYYSDDQVFISLTKIHENRSIEKIEEIIMTEPIFEVYTEKKLLIIRLKREMLKYDDYKVYGIMLTHESGFQEMYR